MNKQLLANRPMTYATRRLKADDEFTASDRDARLLVALRRAREVPTDQPTPIPEDWHELAWPELRSLAASVSADPIKSKDDAVAAIQAEISKRAAKAKD